MVIKEYFISLLMIDGSLRRWGDLSKVLSVETVLSEYKIFRQTLKRCIWIHSHSFKIMIKVTFIQKFFFSLFSKGNPRTDQKNYFWRERRVWILLNLFYGGHSTANQCLIVFPRSVLTRFVSTGT